MTKPFTPRRPTVELQPSRIRREPQAERKQKMLVPHPTERDTWVVVIGVVLFAVAMAIVTVGMSNITSH